MAAHLIHLGVPFSDVENMGISRIIDLHEALDTSYWQNTIHQTRLLQIAAQGTSKDLNKALRPIEQALGLAPKGGRGRNDTDKLMQTFGGKRK